MSVDVVTFGCRLNTYESEAIQREAEAAGLGDVVVVNTCAVTAEATRQARQTIRRLARERPEARIVVTGCAAQVEPGSFASMPEVAHVVGNHAKLKAETWVGLKDEAGGLRVVDHAVAARLDRLADLRGDVERRLVGGVAHVDIDRALVGHDRIQEDGVAHPGLDVEIALGDRRAGGGATRQRETQACRDGGGPGDGERHDRFLFPHGTGAAPHRPRRHVV